MTRRTFRGSLTTVALLAITAVWASAAHPHPAFASCNPGRSPATQSGNWHDGIFKSISIPQDQYGLGTQDAAVLSDVYQYDTYVYGSDHPSAWVMLEKQPGITCCWAQIGWLEFNSGGSKYRLTFTQWTHDGTFSEDDFYDISPGQTTRYEAFYPGGSSPYLYFVNGTEIDDSTGPLVPDSALVSGEIGNLASQMPGGYSSNSAHEVFSNVGYMQNDSWGSFDGQLYNPYSSTFGNYYNGSNWDAIWDGACVS